MTREDRPSAATPRVLGVAALLSSLYVGLALIAHHVVAGTTLDHAVLGWIVQHRSPMLTSSAIVVTQVGSPVGIGALTILASTALWWRHRSPWPASVIVATAPRPEPSAPRPTRSSGPTDPRRTCTSCWKPIRPFPPGTSPAPWPLLGELAAVTGHHVRSAARATLIAVAVAGTAAVALTRAYLGVHWVTDILGGLLLGATATMIADVAYRHLTRPAGTDQSGTSSVSGPIHTVGT